MFNIKNIKNLTINSFFISMKNKYEQALLKNKKDIEQRIYELTYPKYEKEMEVNNMEDNKMRIVSPAEFITAWNEMEKYWINNDGDMDRSHMIFTSDVSLPLMTSREQNRNTCTSMDVQNKAHICHSDT